MINSNKLTITEENEFKNYFLDMLETIFSCTLRGNTLIFKRGEQFVINTYVKEK